MVVITLSELFQGHRVLFEGLWVHDRWDWEATYPVIHLSMNSLGYKELGLEKALTLRLEKIAAQYGLTLQSEVRQEA